MRVKDLAPNPRNPRKITNKKLEMLRNSLLEFGDLSGVVFNRTSQTLVGGHQRTKVIPLDATVNITTTYETPTRTGTIAEGHILIDGEKLQYREVCWDEIKEKAANIAANKHGGDWDLPALSEFLLELDAANYDLDLTGFEKDELENLMAPVQKVEPQCDEDDIPEKVEPKTRLGDIYQLGRHRLMCGDSTSIDAVEKLMNGEKADMWIADPPFGVSYMEKNAAVHGGIVKNQTGKEIKSDTKTVEELCPFWRDVASNAYLVTTDQASNYWCACQGSDKMMMMMMMDEAGWNIRHELIWVKSSFVFGRSDYHYRHEPIIYGWKKKGTHNWYGDRKQDSVLEIDRPHKSDLHPTTKPVDLFENFIQNSTKTNDLIFESFGGSGTTMIASEKIGRRSNSMELDPHYCDVIVARWEKYTGKKAELLTPHAQEEGA